MSEHITASNGELKEWLDDYAAEEQMPELHEGKHMYNIGRIKLIMFELATRTTE